jgi:hypothetical protein
MKINSIKKGTAVCLAALCMLLPAALFAQATMFDDLEGGTNQNKFLGYWYFYTDSDDGGTSAINNAVPNGTELLFTGAYGDGREGSLHAAVVDYQFGANKPSCGGTCTFGQFVGVGSGFVPEGEVIDMSTATEITFWMKGSAPMTVRVEIATADILDFAFYRIEADVGLAWAEYTIDFSDFINFAQPSWGDPADFNPVQIQKIQWQISAEDDNPETGKLWIDDIEVHGYIWTPPSMCPVIGEAGIGANLGAALSDMEGEEPNQNAYGEYWYAYNDAEGRVVGPGEFTDVFGGVVPDPFDPTVIDIKIDGNGYGGTNGAYIQFQLGPTYVENLETIKPFAGVGTRTSDNLGLGFYNATLDNATGIYFDYKTEGATWVSFEVKANQEFPNPGIVHHCLAPGTNGLWKSATVAFADLVLPSWDEVNQLPAAMKILKTNALEKLQWAVQDEPGIQGSLTVDNVHLIGATSITGVETPGSRSRLVPEMQITAGRSTVIITIPGAEQEMAVTVMNAAGEAVASQWTMNGSVSISADKLSGGVYFAQVSMTGSDGKQNTVKKSFTWLN